MEYDDTDIAIYGLYKTMRMTDDKPDVRLRTNGDKEIRFNVTCGPLDLSDETNYGMTTMYQSVIHHVIVEIPILYRKKSSSLEMIQYPKVYEFDENKPYMRLAMEYNVNGNVNIALMYFEKLLNYFKL
ncbi:hypothetical protein HDE_04999 [Halotydeus destructor]|nr:hypothetical protein HDE_04999 [Halotydeus destructor]